MLPSNMPRVEAQRLRTLRRRHDYLVRRLEEDDGAPASAQRDYLQAELGALSWALQELDEVRPELHSHTIKVVKAALVTEMRKAGVDEWIVHLVREHCNLMTRRISTEPIDAVARRYADD